MGILSRFKDIMSANINALLDKCEDPAKMIDEYMRKLMDQLAEVKKETSAVIAEEKRAKRALDENSEQIKKYEDLAKKALTAGNEEDAKVFIAKKQSYDAKTATLTETYEAAKANSDKMRQMHDKLTKDIQELQSRREQIKAKTAVAKTQQRLNDLAGNVDKTSDVMAAFDRMEAKADNMLDKAEAMSELNESAADPADKLEKKYTDASDASVESELEKMKAEMGLS
ncbi:MAG: PspA/IM30 family protein [Clostridiales bacterium]|nr:PspA/IM30 family protein [Clostridiales bacterium]